MPRLGLRPSQRNGPAGRPNQPGTWPVRQPRNRPPARELRQRALASLVLGLLSLVALFGLRSDLSRGVWLLVFSAVIGAAACVIGITAVVKARRTGTFRPGGAIGGIVLGAFATLIATVILLTYLAFPTQMNDYVKCLSQAQTSAQQHACETKLSRSMHLGWAKAPAGQRRSAGATSRSAMADRLPRVNRSPTRAGR